MTNKLDGNLHDKENVITLLSFLCVFLGNSAVEPEGCGVLRATAIGYLRGVGVPPLAQSQSHAPLHDPRTRGEAQSAVALTREVILGGKKMHPWSPFYRSL